MTIINVKYGGGFNPDLDRDIENIVGEHSVSSGFWIPTGERDLQFDIPAETVTDTISRLQAIGVSAERRKPFEVIE